MGKGSVEVDGFRKEGLLRSTRLHVMKRKRGKAK